MTKKTIFLILGAVLIVAIATVVTLIILKAGQLKTHWDVLNEQYIQDNEDAEMGQVVFLGDSITEGFAVNEFLSSDLQLYNRGIGGDTTGGILKRLESNVLSIRPSIIVLLIGINDIHSGIEVSEIVSNLTEILDLIHTELPQCKVYIESLYPTNNQAYAFLSGFWGKIDECNIQYQDLAETYGYEYIDIHSSLLLGEELNRDYSSDGLHLNQAGYDIVCAKLVEKIPELTINQ